MIYTHITYQGYNEYHHNVDISLINGCARITYKGYNIVWNRTLISFMVTNAPYSAQLYTQLVEELLPYVLKEEELQRNHNRSIAKGAYNNGF